MFGRRRWRKGRKAAAAASSEPLYEIAGPRRRSWQPDLGCFETIELGECCGEAACSAGDCFNFMVVLGFWKTALSMLTRSHEDTPPPGRSRSHSRSARAAIGAIRVYQREISPKHSPCCRFTPTCSAYGAESIARHGAIRGGWQTAQRLRRCGRRRVPGGADPVR
jgi:putative membrane protein insertion efficiency factor